MNNGGSVDFKDTTLNMNDSTFENCVANNDGGCVFMDENSQMRLTNIEFENRKAENDGGCVYIHQMSTDISLTNISTKLCFAQGFGGDIFASIVISNALSISDFDSIDSSANDTGSVMYVSGDTQISELNLENINIISNNILPAVNYDVHSGIY